MLEWEWREALQKEGCPVCRINKQDAERFWRRFVLEDYYSWSMIDMLVNGGFCPVHGVQAEDRVGKQLSIPLSYVVKLRRLNLEAMLPVLKKKPSLWQNLFHHANRLPRKFLGFAFRQQKCPLCDTIEFSEKHALSTLQKKEPADLELLYASDGLCWRHFLMALEMFDRETSALLVQDYISRLHTLEKQFDEYFQKIDYHFAHESKGEEQEAWLRALRLLMGDKRWELADK